MQWNYGWIGIGPKLAVVIHNGLGLQGTR